MLPLLNVSLIECFTYRMFNLLNASTYRMFILSNFSLIECSTFRMFHLSDPDTLTILSRSCNEDVREYTFLRFFYRNRYFLTSSLQLLERIARVLICLERNYILK